MGGAVTLIVLVAAGAASDPTTVAMRGATHDALGGALVEVRETRGLPDDETAVAIETSAHADAVVELGWADPHHRQANLRLHIASGGRWIERVIHFKPSDAQAERGRTLGFAVASMLPEAAAEGGAPNSTSSPGSTATSAPAPPASATSSPPPPPVDSPLPAVSPSPPSTPPVVTPPAAAAPAPPPPPARPTAGASALSTAESPRAAERPSHEVAIDLVALGSVGLSGSADAVGGGTAGNWFVFRTVSLRLAAGVRAGTIGSAAGVGTLTFLGAAGVGWNFWRSTSPRPFALSLRVDYLVERLSATGFAEPHSRPPVSGVDALVETALQLTADVDALVELGLEDVFAKTYIDLQGARVATLPSLQAVAETGVRLRF